MAADIRDFFVETILFIPYFILRRSEEAVERGFEVFLEVQESPFTCRTLSLEIARRQIRGPMDRE
jgi:hypothetical protein